MIDINPYSNSCSSRKKHFKFINDCLEALSIILLMHKFEYIKHKILLLT